MPVILALPVSAMIALGGILLTSAVQTAIDYAYERRARRKLRKELLDEYRKWYDKAGSCDDFGGAMDKGRAVAMLIVIDHELKKSVKNPRRSEGEKRNKKIKPTAIIAVNGGKVNGQRKIF